MLNMLNLKVRPYFDRCLVVLTTGLLLCFSHVGLASDFEEENEVFDPEALVEVHVAADPAAPYSERKSNWSWRFSADYENFYPSSYISPADGASYQTIFGSNQGNLVTASLGTQYNTRLGAFFLDTQYGVGGVSSGTGTLTISKNGITFGYMLDVLGKSPWVSPFIAGQAIYFNYKETDTGIQKGSTTALTIGVVAGISIHLDKIDTDTARDAYVGYGIKNSFLDIYGVQYNTSNSAEDPDLQTAWNVGAGFHFEF